ncbi:hypothetical protein BB560_004343 [Smittium megazygosporum]|uniref:ABC transporter domain-containing protein n=1 Tax=Smittium megazygosporum TaxID=133381 RepID=A0A2T9Z9H5_9FUNG|nr:hypothetical protein BB560_004343 [Smittium megazygosporum]
MGIYREKPVGDNASIVSLGSDANIRGRKSYQARALARSKLSYQKRQFGLNFCASICPFLMVAIGGIIGIAMKKVLAKTYIPQSYLMCPNINASDAFNMPISSFQTNLLPKVPGNQIPNAFKNKDYYALNHYLLPITLSGRSFGSEVFVLSDEQPSCVWSYEHDYPFSYPYQNDPKVSLSDRFDTTSKPDPLGGWFGTQFLAQNPLKLLLNQKLSWMIVDDLSGTNSAGSREKMPDLNINFTSMALSAETGGNYIQDLVSSNLNSTKNSNTTGSGLVSKIDTNYFMTFTSSKDSMFGALPSAMKPVPWYESSSIQTKKDIDDQLADKIRSTLEDFQKLPTNAFNVLYGNVSSVDDFRSFIGFYLTITPIVEKMPWGALIFDKIDNQNLQWKYTLQIGEDNQITNSGAYPTAINRIMTQQVYLGNAMLRSATGNDNANIVHQFRILPQIYYYELGLPIGSLVGSSLYPFGITFLISMFVLILVREKEERILVMMRMNGLKYTNYYIAHYIHFYILTIFASFFFLLTGKLFRLELFAKTSLPLLIVLLLVWGHVQVILSFLFSVFFNKSKNAQVIVSLITIWSILIDAAMSFVFPDKTPLYYFIWPPFAMYRGLAKLSMASIATDSTPYQFSDVIRGDEVFNCFIALMLGWIVYFALALYLNMVVPNDYGITKPWHFILTDFFRKKKKEPIEISSYDESELMFEDDDVKAERNRVLQNFESKDSPLILKRVRKDFGSGKVAVKDVTFSVNRGTIFGLLGPNGAGKTTSISMLTGLYPISSGTALLAGFDVSTETKQVYRHLGICPQHDILWDDLSVEEHLYFYARLKGISPKNEKAVVDNILDGVELTPFKNKMSKKLSGGQKRRLSIAIALVGNPDVVFLDEPTTGLDPEVRRTVWNIISANKAGRTIVITTHSMEEAEVLCNRIGIMANGTMRCIGTSFRLKQLYGSGFLISIAAPRENLPAAKNFISSVLPSNARLLDNFVNAASWEFKPEPGFISKLYTIISTKARKYNITDFGINQTTLDEVFLRIIGDNDNTTE